MTERSRTPPLGTRGAARHSAEPLGKRLDDTYSTTHVRNTENHLHDSRHSTSAWMKRTLRVDTCEEY